MTDLCDETGINKSSMFSLLRTMETLQWVVKDEGEAYALGAGVSYYNTVYNESLKQNMNLVERFLSGSAQSVKVIGETFQLSILDRDEIIYLAKQEGPSLVKLESSPGMRFPAHATAMGKMMLALLPEDEIGRRYSGKKLSAVTSRTLTDWAGFTAALSDIRQAGYAVDREEIIQGISCVAAPVLDAAGNAVAATLQEIMKEAIDEPLPVHTAAEGPAGKLPLTGEMLRTAPSGEIFGMTQNAGMGWNPLQLNRPQYLILGTMGGIRREDGSPLALGYHTGHWEIGVMMEEIAEEITANQGIPFAGYVSDPCDGRSQGTTGMFDSLPYRNDAAIVLRRLIRSLPTRRGVLGVATCDKGLPAMMVALAGMRQLPGIIVPGGVTLPPVNGEDAGKVQSIGARFSNGELSLEDAADLGCRACATPGGGCQFLGTAATAQ
ncbi:hypothetical protein KC345_g11138, partial [Hortaea werneckii]